LEAKPGELVPPTNREFAALVALAGLAAPIALFIVGAALVPREALVVSGAVAADPSSGIWETTMIKTMVLQKKLLNGWRFITSS
jgi:hypothetical protein